ncbi:MAG: hypothetical protein KC502_11330 [Myxococcales bacterium]|nr:hypothetical protein [Myxococcales bacterium]
MPNHRTRQPSRLQRLILVLGLALAGCDAHDDHPAAEDPVITAIEEGCGHLTGSVASAVTLSVDAASAPNMTANHKRVDVTFAQLPSGKYGGRGLWQIAEAGDYVVALSSGVSMQVVDKDGKPVAPEAVQNMPKACAAAQVARVYPLLVGTYTFTFGPTDETGCKLIVEETAGHVLGTDGH